MKDIIDLNYELYEIWMAAIKLMKEAGFASMAYQDFKLLLQAASDVRVPTPASAKRIRGKANTSEEQKLAFRQRQKAVRIRKHNPQYASFSTLQMMQQPWWDDYTSSGILIERDK